MSDEAPEVAPVTPAPAEAPATPESIGDDAETFIEEVTEKFVNIFDAAKSLVELVEQHRSIGDEDVAAAVADVKQAVAAYPQPATDAPKA